MKKFYLPPSLHSIDKMHERNRKRMIPFNIAGGVRV